MLLPRNWNIDFFVKEYNIEVESNQIQIVC